MPALPRRSPRAARTALLTALLTLLLAGAAVLVAAAPAATAVPAPAVPAGRPVAIEPLAAYVAQTSCDPVTKAGTAKLAHLLTATYPGTSVSTVYPCGTDGNRSEHYDGRALDWMVSVGNATQRAQAGAVINWLLATDRRGRSFANARRLGVMYVIFNNRIWGSWSGAWAPYNNCAKQPQAGYDNQCHRTHMHISLSWNGALGRTTFWAQSVVATDFGPCRPRDLNWAATRTRPNASRCAGYATVAAARAASATKAELVKYSGAGVHVGSTGPAVTAVQRALRVSATGYYGAATRSAVLTFQRSHRVLGTGSMIPAAWRALLAAVR
jgi:hypothetical protein